MDEQTPAQRLANELKQKGITQQQVLDAIAQTPRDRFVLSAYKDSAYIDHALPIECGQTISQPYVVAAMSQLLMTDSPLQRVLEIGTGSGYQAAVLSKLATDVYSIERIKVLYDSAKMVLADYDNVHLKHGDGYQGWSEHAPYDGIIVTAAAPHVPAALRDQLADDAHLVIPVEQEYGQVLRVITRHGNTYHEMDHDPVLFVPLLPGIE